MKIHASHVLIGLITVPLAKAIEIVKYVMLLTTELWLSLTPMSVENVLALVWNVKMLQYVKHVFPQIQEINNFS